jgi:hypothetical protein
MRLLLETQNTGFEGVIPFEAESVESAQATMKQTIDAAVKAGYAYKELLHRETAYLRELYQQRNNLALDEISDDLKNKIKSEMERTSTKNFPPPPDNFTFYGIELSIGDFEYMIEGERGMVTSPNIITVDAFFACLGKVD